MLPFCAHAICINDVISDVIDKVGMRGKSVVWGVVDMGVVGVGVGGYGCVWVWRYGGVVAMGVW